MDEGGATPSYGPDAYTRWKGLPVLCGHSQLSLRLCAVPLQSSDGDLSLLPVPGPCPPTCFLLGTHTASAAHDFLRTCPCCHCSALCASPETLTAPTTANASGLLPVPSQVWAPSTFQSQIWCVFCYRVHSSAPPEPPAAVC